jgi:hypothetical protein
MLGVWVGTACASQLHVSACNPYAWPVTKPTQMCNLAANNQGNCTTGMKPQYLQQLRLALS